MNFQTKIVILGLSLIYMAQQEHLFNVRTKQPMLLSQQLVLATE